MASTLIGALRVVLSADTAEFKTGLGEAAKVTTQFTGQLSGVTTQIASFTKVFAGMFTIGALTAAASKVIDYASTITDLAAQTGLTTDSIQEMAHAAKQTGSSLESFTNAAFKLGTNLSDGTIKVQAATERLGLSYEALRQMAPDEQFKTIAEALGQVQNAQERNELGVVLMGKAYKSVAAAITEGYGELARAAAISGKDQIKALQDAGDALDRFKSKLMALGVMLGGSFAKAMENNIAQFKRDGEFLDKYVGTVRHVQNAVSDWGTIFGKVAEAPKVFGSAMKDLPAPIKAVSMSYEDQTKTAKVLTAQVERSIESRKKEVEALDKAKESHDRFAASVQRLDTAEWFVPFKKGALLANRELEELESNTDLATSAMMRYHDAVEAESTEAVRSFHAISDAVKNLGNTILGAVQGGGSVMKSIGSSMGAAIGTDFVENFGTKVTKLLGTTLGGAFNAVIPGIGALLGPALEKIGSSLKKVFGIGLNDDVKKANVEIGKLKQHLIDTHGSLEKLEAMAQSVGLSFEAAWGHQGQAGLEAFTKLVDEFEQRWADLNDNLKTTQGELDGLIGKARDLGYEFDRNGEFIGVSFDTVKAKADEFGVSVEGLGPKFRQQGIDAEAGKIINAFTLLAKAGGDVGGILVGMKDEIGKLVSDSIKFGTTIPKNMQPWIVELMRTDQLIDENGNKITDLSQITFGEPVADQFETISLALKEVVLKLQEILNQIGAIPTTRTLTVTAQYNDPGPPPGFGDPGPSNARRNSDEGFASGTLGQSGSWFKDFGAGIPTTLHGIEAVVTQQQAPSFAMEMLSRMGGGMAQASASDAGVVEAIARLERTLLITMPAVAESAARHGAQTSGRRR